MKDLHGEPDVAPCGLDAIFRPRSVAVIGAGREATSMSGRLFRNLLASFHGSVYPINPNATEICGERAFPTILEVPEPVDLAFIVVPARAAIAAIGQCLEKHVRGLVVITAGFSETDAAGQQRQRELLEIVRAAGVRMVGPNCFGVFNTDPAIGLQGTFGNGAIPSGNIGIASQSGALGIVIPEYLRHWGVGASMFASVGNKADVNENDLMSYWRDDPTTDVILLYLESFSDAREFRRIATEVTRHKPIVALKAGRTQAGARAASSHTAALASPDRAANALFAQTNVLRVETLPELFDVTTLLATQPLPRGRRVGILTNAGGPAILCADVLAANGLTLPEFSQGLQANLRSFLRPETSVRNPVDLIASIDVSEYRRCLELVMASGEVDALITIYVPREPGTSPAIARAVREVTASRGSQITSLAVFMQLEGAPAELHDGTVKVPSFLSPEAAAGALVQVSKYAERLAQPSGATPSFADIRRTECRDIVVKACQRLGAVGGWLEPEEAMSLLAAARLPIARWSFVNSADDAVAIAQSWQSPVALKVVSPSVLHKTDIGGVVLNVRGDAAIRDAFETVMRTASDARGVFLQEFVSEGQECLIGVTRDPQFSHLLTFGLGGVLVELLDDVVCRLHPLTDRDADEMLTTLRTSAVLSGYRGRPAADVAALREALLRLSALVSVVPEIVELDFNPIKALTPGHGIRVVDARIRVSAIPTVAKN